MARGDTPTISFNVRKLSELDLDNLVLELYVNAVYEKLVVYIRDPTNPKQYFRRLISVKSIPVETKKQESGRLEEESSFKFGRYGEDSFLEKLAYTESELQNGIQQEIGDNPKTVVGIARYNGTNPLSLNQIMGIAALKYYQSRTAYLKKTSAH